ncbi:MAG: tetratricopeptide repeat protein [Desulfovibrionaceae bacterium]|nr:tetratricopeptide repeat protein [Desulfovibrionaceae bacterium]
MYQDKNDIPVDIEEAVLQKRYEAILFLDFNKPIESMELFQQCLSLDTVNVETYNELGLVFYLRFRNYEEALFHYQKALGLNDSLFFLHYQYALVLEKMGRYEEACSSYIKAIECDGDRYFTAQAYIAIGELYIQSGRRDEEVAELYTRAIADIEDYFLLYYHKAMWLFYRKRYKEALETAYKALEYNSYFPKAYYLISSIYARMEHWILAEEYAQKAMKYAEYHPLYTIWYEKITRVYDAYLLYTKDRYTVLSFLSALEAIEGYDVIHRIVEEYEEVTLHYPSLSLGLQKNKALVLLYRGLYKEALECIQAMYGNATCAEEQIAMQCIQASIYEAMKEYAYAGECYATCYFLCDESEKYRYSYNAGCSYREAKVFQEAILWFHYACTAEPSRYDVVYEYIEALFSDDMVQEGIAALEHLRTFSIHKEYIFERCVEILHSLGLYRECLRWCELWKQYNPGNYLAYYYSACARYARQYFLDAVENMKYACLLSPSNSVCRQALEMVEEEQKKHEKAQENM